MTKRPTEDDLIADNGDQLTADEWRAIQALHRLSRIWPRTLTLISMGSGLHVMHTADPRFDGIRAERVQVVLDSFDSIPNDGGDW